MALRLVTACRIHSVHHGARGRVFSVAAASSLKSTLGAEGTGTSGPSSKAKADKEGIFSRHGGKMVLGFLGGVGVWFFRGHLGNKKFEALKEEVEMACPLEPFEAEDLRCANDYPPGVFPRLLKSVEGAFPSGRVCHARHLKWAVVTSHNSGAPPGSSGACKTPGQGAACRGQGRGYSRGAGFRHRGSEGGGRAHVAGYGFPDGGVLVRHKHNTRRAHPAGGRGNMGWNIVLSVLKFIVRPLCVCVCVCSHVYVCVSLPTSPSTIHPHHTIHTNHKSSKKPGDFPV
ncbi:unnamed protein product [Discosporangium mesarthrocarpum]